MESTFPSNANGDAASSGAAAATENGDVEIPPSTGSSSRLLKNSGIPRPSRLPSRRFGAPWQRSSSTTVDGSDEGNEDAAVGTEHHAPHENAVGDDRNEAADVTTSTVGTAPTSRETTPFSSPTRATRLREPGWLKRKRPREEIRSVFVTERSLEDEHVTRRRAPLLSLIRAPSSVSSSQTTAPATEDDAELEHQQQDEEEQEEEVEEEVDPEVALKIATCLQRDLLRDRARLRLKIDSLRDDIEVYYELLARIETTAVDAAATGSVVDDRNRALISRIQEIISARRPSATVATEVADEEPMEEKLLLHEEQRELVEDNATSSTVEM